MGAVAFGLLLVHLVALREATEAGHAGAPLFGLFWALALILGRAGTRTSGSDAEKGRGGDLLVNEKRT
jgi:hypothetical protein